MLAGICTCSARREREVEGESSARALRMSVPTSAERTFCLPLSAGELALAMDIFFRIRRVAPL
ncbi:hypothetical protein D3C77_756360 [compost metagenome]